MRYSNLVKVAIETAFDDKNKDTELLLRVLFKQKQIKLKDGNYINPIRHKTFRVLGIQYEREKVFLIDDDKLDAYTRHLEEQNEYLKKQLKDCLEKGE